MRSQWYVRDSDGYLAGMLFLTNEEYSRRSDKDSLVGFEPPARPIPQIDQLAHAKTISKALLKGEKNSLMAKPMTVSGITIDADSAALSALTAKLMEMQYSSALAEEHPPGTLVWRDAGNVDHEFATAAEFYEWLIAAVTAISKRNTQIHLEYWSKKSAVENATNEREAADIAGGNMLIETV